MFFLFISTIKALLFLKRIYQNVIAQVRERSAMNREVPGSNPGRGFSLRINLFFSFDYVFHTSKLDFNGERVALTSY